MKLIILDRDGVINYDSDDYIKSVDEWHAIPGSLQAIADFNRAGYKVVVVTNQSGIGRKMYSLTELNQMHNKMENQLAQIGGKIDAIYYCPHVAEDNCNCRKPKTGLYERISINFNVDLAGVVAIGDTLTDLQAAYKMKCQPILVRSGKGERTLADPQYKTFTQTITNIKIPVYNDLAEFARFFLKTTENN